MLGHDKLGDVFRVLLARIPLLPVLSRRIDILTVDESDHVGVLFNAPAFTQVGQQWSVYRTLLDRDSGPKAGNLLAFLDRDFLRQRFRELPYEQAAFWYETSISREEFDAWLTEHQDHIKQMTTEAKLLPPLPLGEGRGAGEDQAQPEAPARLGVVECVVELEDNRVYMQRVQLGEFAEQTAFDAAAQAYVESVTG